MHEKDKATLFFAIDLDSMADQFETLISHLRENNPDAPISWRPIDRLHITLRYLGETSKSRIPELCQDVAKTMQHQKKCTIATQRLRIFPSMIHPKVIAMTFQPESQKKLQRLVDPINTTLDEMGFKSVTRPYRPHITLGYIKNTPLPHIDMHPPNSIYEIDVKSFHLYTSEQTNDNNVYRSVELFHLAV